MMRKIFPILLMLAFISQKSAAEAIPMARAKAAAEQFMRQAAPDRSPRLRLLTEGPRMTKAGPEEPAYFIFADEGGGFVIAAGDDAVPSVLGYSTSSSIRTEGMPENLRGWLDMWRDIVRDARQTGAAPFRTPVRAAAGDKLELETALWDQADPYNRYCIEMDGKKAMTGCVATAIAIAMRYHKWPAAGSGTLPSYKFSDESTGTSYTVPAVELGRPYAWDLMPMTRYDGTWSDEQKDEIAYLMRDAGVMVQATYSPSGTGAFMEDVAAAMIRYMGYDGAMTLDSNVLYDSTEDWVARLKENIRQVGPVLYGASTEGENPSGHAFVLDGYDEHDNLHINWGWSGNGNGYFVMPAFNEYTRGHQAVLGAKKDAGGTPVDDLRLYNIGVSASVTSFSVGTPFTMSCRSVANYGTQEFSGEIAFAKFDKDGTMEEVLSDPVSVSVGSYYVTNVNDVPCVIRTAIRPGDVARPVYRSARTKEWTPVRYDHESMIVGKVAVGDTVFLDEIVRLDYDAQTGLLTVSFSEEASLELRRNGSALTTGVTASGDSVVIDAHQFQPDTYTLHLQRGSQEKDITLKFGLKK